MNSYPAELLAQHVPLMFVAGLTDDSPALAAQHTGMTPSNSTGMTLSTSGAPSTTTSSEAVPTVQTTTTSDDPFADLVARLKNVLTYRKKGAVWDPNRSKSFQILLVDKNVRFPPRKVVSQQARSDGSASPTGSAHSPLSPVTPTSPVYPDGLIAPIWVRKHTELVPSVFVLFLRLAELPMPSSPLEGRDDTLKEEERRRDGELATEIGARKKVTAERGIKLTVVLLASRKMLDDPSLDSRLSYIRRQSGLDSRAALFVLSPVSQTELQDFVKSLQSALHESAVEYYAAHSKRVRRKRNRHSHSNQASISSIPAAPAPQAGPRPLRSIGWSVRYEYKLAFFAEFRMEEEVARKHYEDCWTMLVDMFGSTAVLPPRTKRWAEAKVLADCIAIKLTKLYLYHNEPQMALAIFNRHVQRFGDLSRGWGIGEETFEYWSWMARQYRILAELLEMALRAGYKLPTPSVPAILGKLPPTASNTPPVPGADLRTSGANPANIIQHPGYYYYTAANCTLQRYERFLLVLEQEEKQPGALSQTPGFSNEKKVEHHVIVIELFTKAYELFKRFRTGQSRQTFYIAYRIAETYHISGNYEAAIRFFERIAKTYRREHWGSMLKAILLMWYDCARHLADMELTVKLLFQLLSSGVTEDAEERQTYVEDLEAILKTSAPPSPDTPLVLTPQDETNLLTATVVFWHSQVFVGEASPLQISLVAPDDVSLANLGLSTVTVRFSDDKIPPIIIKHSEAEATSPMQVLDSGSVPVPATTEVPPLAANLGFPVGGGVIVCGSLTSQGPIEYKAATVTCEVKQKAWTVEIQSDIVTNDMSPKETARRKRWLASRSIPSTFVPVLRTDCSTCAVLPKPHRVEIEVEHQAPAYLDEDYPIVIKVSNTDERDLDTVLDVLLHPAEDDSVNKITLEDQESAALIKGVPFGILSPGASASKILRFASRGSPGTRILDVSIRTTIPDPNATSDDQTDSSETLNTIAVPVTKPLACTSDIRYHRTTRPLRPMLDLALYDHGEFSPSLQATMTTDVVNTGKYDIELSGINWSSKESSSVRLVDVSLESDKDSFPLILSPGDEYSLLSRLDVDPEDDLGEPSESRIPCPGQLVVRWRRKGNETWATSTLELPSLRPPSDGIIGLLSLPASAALHRPFTLTLTVQNRHVSRTADIVLQSEVSEAFVVAGPRSSRLPTLLPGSTVDVRFNVVPLMCGECRIPAFKVYDRRQVSPPSAANGEAATEDTVALEPVQVIDEELDARDSHGHDLVAYTPDEHDPSKIRARREGISILVLPTF